MRVAVRWLLAAIFMIDGVLHFAFADLFAAIVPPLVPAAHAVVLATGIAAFAGGAGLLIPRLRRAAGIALALYCIGVYPANVHHALAPVGDLTWAYHGPRLLLQPVIVWACLWVGNVTDWPFARAREAARPPAR